MKRLTERDEDGFVYTGIDTNCVNGCYDIWDKKWLDDALDRLAAIEDILGGEYELDRLRELVEVTDLLGNTVYEPNKRGFISTYEIISVHISTCSVLVGWNLLDGIYSNLDGFEISALGKTVFLTRAEAEAALKAREQK